MTSKSVKFQGSMRHSFCAVLLGIGWTGGQTVEASYDNLVKALKDNGHLTDEQVESLKSSAVQVRTANNAVKDLQVLGRIQSQIGYVDAKNDEGRDSYSTFEVRRARIGLRGTLFDSVRTQMEANLVPGSAFSMRSAFLQWRAYKPAYVKLGYDKPHSSLEENTSSGEIITLEKTLINSIVAAPGPMTGLSVDGDMQILSYGLGVYTDTDNRNASGAEPKYLYNARLGLNLDRFVGKENRLLVQATYLKSEDLAGKLGSRFDKTMAVGVRFIAEKFDIRGEYLSGEKNDQAIKGWYVMPSQYLSDNLQTVLRFEAASSDQELGITAPSRYTRNVPDLQTRDVLDNTGVVGSINPLAGKEYQSVYIGVNYYLQGHAHKLMAGIELAELAETDAGKLTSTSISTGWRMMF